MIETAGQTAIARSGIAGLAERLAKGPEPGPLVAEALEKGLDDAALALVLAACVGGQPCNVADALPLLTRSVYLDDVPMVVAATIGDRIEALLTAAETGGLDWERQGLLLYLAAQLVEGAAPDRLVLLLRRLARRDLQPHEAIYVALAARALGDPDLEEVAGPWIPLAGDPQLCADADHLCAPMRKPLMEVLPEEAAPRTVSGFTVRRAAKKVGRNEPCPCGSGKKYKKCCERKDRERLADPSPVPGVTMQEYLARPHDYLEPADIGRLPAHELSRLPLADMPTAHLEEAVRTLVLDWAWTDAERALDVLAGREDTSRPADEYRELFVVEAWRAGEKELVRRHLGEISEERYRDNVDILRELLEPTAGALARIEQEAVQGLREEPWRGSELAIHLLADYPAFGILVARGALDPENPDSCEFLLEAIEEARDRLQLPPGDPAGAMMHALLRADEPPPAEQDETEELRSRLEKTNRRAEALERELSLKEERLAEQARARPAASSEARKPSGEREAAGAEVELLRAKVSHLKSLIADSKEERSKLRGEIDRLARRAEARASEAAASPAPQPEPDPAPVETGEAPAFRRPLIPQLATRAREAVAAADPKLARRAMQVVFDLALGQRRSAAQVKRLERVGDLWSARVGIHHRLLFRFDEEAGALEVLDLIEREELKTRLKKLS